MAIGRKRMQITHKNEVSSITMAPGVSRRVLSHTPQLMLVEVTFASGAVVPAHSHPHQQISYIKSGRFSYETKIELDFRNCSIKQDSEVA